MVDIKVPTVGESISEVTLIKWVKQEGEYVERDEVIAELESEKATLNTFLASGGNGDYRAMAEKGERLAKLEEELDETMMKWLEMSEMLE